MDTHRRHLLQLSLAAGLAPGLLRHARADASPRFDLGVASGHPAADGMVLWTRLTGADLPARVEVRWEVAEDEAFKQLVAAGTETAEAGWAHSVHAEPAGLKPGRWYWYRFEALGQRSVTGRTRTTPAADALEPLRFAIASCQRWDHGFFAAWRHMRAEELDLVMFLGDYIYEYGGAPGRARIQEGGEAVTLAQYRARYAQYKSDPDLQTMHAAVPWLFVWDDHEVENDYANLRGGLIAPDFPARRAAAYQAYWEHQPLPKAWRPRGVDMRMHGRHAWGRLALIHALDDRQYRDPQVCTRTGRYGSNTLPLRECPELLDPQRTLLGSAQEKWLAEGWDTTPGRWNLVAQQTLMARMNWNAAEPTYWTDGWDGYAPARNRLLATVRERRVPNVVVLGGDVHSHVVADLKADFDDADSPTVASEFCGSSISSWAGKQSLDELRTLNPHLHYARNDQRGYMVFTLDAQQGLRATVRSLDNALKPDSSITTAARFVVASGRAGVQPG